jgi:mannosyl-oligosaccharide alpha-1,2-mannosidase
MAWEIFHHITAATRARYGYSSIRDVLTPGGWYQSDQTESFWLAETLKYLFLIFDDPERVSLDDWVFNTEAHPLRRGGGELGR